MNSKKQTTFSGKKKCVRIICYFIRISSIVSSLDNSAYPDQLRKLEEASWSGSALISMHPVNQYVNRSKTIRSIMLLVSSADNLCKQFAPRSSPTKYLTWFGSNLLTLRWYSWKNFSKKLILKKIGRRQKNMKNFPGVKELKLVRKQKWVYMGLVARKPVFWVSDKVRFKRAC